MDIELLFDLIEDYIGVDGIPAAVFVGLWLGAMSCAIGACLRWISGRT